MHLLFLFPFQPIQMMKWTVNWLTGNFIWLMVRTQLYQMWNPNEAWAYTHGSNMNQHYPDILENDDQLPPLAPSEWGETEGQGATVVAPGKSIHSLFYDSSNVNYFNDICSKKGSTSDFLWDRQQ